MSFLPTKTTVEVTVGDVEFVLVSNNENFLLNSGLHGDQPILALVYTIHPGEPITQNALANFRSSQLERDDVFQSNFYENLVFFGAKKEDVHIDEGTNDMLRSWGVKTHTFIPSSSAAKVPSGPYVYTDEKTWQPWRVYYDFNACFMVAFKPQMPGGSLVAVDSSQAGLGRRAIVPSRCYFNPSSSRPLDGVRISVKDSIDIAGHKTTLCNRAWMDFYPPKEKHAACIQTFLNAGAIIVGKVKLQAMIMREEPLECVEFTAPFNPRADGYQVPSGSSHASAAGISTYDWIDFSIGSDTNGSGRKPASYNGCFSIRPTTGIMDTQGVVAFFPEFDMPVFFGRNISRFPGFISAWYGDSPRLRKPSKVNFNILYPSDYLPTANPAQTHLIENFISGFESAFKTMKIKVSLADLWASDCPDGKKYDDVVEYLDTAGIYPFYYDQYHNLAEFRDGYAREYGKPPFVHRALLWQWDQAKKVSKDERDECLRRCNVYREWLLEKVFKAKSEDTITVMALPIEIGQPNYRDAPLPPYGNLSGFNPLHMSPIMRAPEITAPVGHIPYKSIVTDREEPLPIAVSLIGAPGTDLVLAELVEKAMAGAGLPAEVKTGRSVF